MGFLLPALLLAVAPPPSTGPFVIVVRDGATGRGVPLVELRTTHMVKYFTDSAGVVAFDEPGLMGREVHFSVRCEGYEHPADGFGFRGFRVVAKPGAVHVVRLKRTQIAERLYRVTGAGVYRDSVLAGRAVPTREPVLAGGVMGCDTVLNAVYRGKIHWVYGDTLRADYPLGNFDASGATSDLPHKSGLSPSVGVDLRWHVDGKGFAKRMAPMPGSGPTWVTSLVVLPDEKKVPRLAASYIKVKPPLEAYARGIAVYDDAKDAYVKDRDFDFKAPAHPTGHALVHDGYVYFCHPLPYTRVKATIADFRDPSRYEAYTCLTRGTTVADGRIEHDAAGKPVWSWKRETQAVGPEECSKLVAAKKLKPEDGPCAIRDAVGGKFVRAHGGTVAWNAYRKKWIAVFAQVFGTSMLGEVWYAEADAPEGPWTTAVKIATHERYDFYNPKQHPMFDEEGGRVIYFEGTYTKTFSGNPEAVPRYEYNQLMYRLDLSDPRLRAK